MNPLFIGIAVAGLYYLFSKKSTATIPAPVAPVKPAEPVKPAVGVVKSVPAQTTTTIQISPPTYDAEGNRTAPAICANYNAAGQQVGANFTCPDSYQATQTELQKKSVTGAWGGSGYQPVAKSGSSGLQTVQISPPTYDADGNETSPALFANFDTNGKQVGEAFTRQDSGQTGVIRRRARFGK